jgi:hypothetical protein
MIRRGFWLTAGAVTGIMGYRRVSARASLTSAGRPDRGRRLARRGAGGAVGLARETFRFTRDVREGMELYMARHSAPAGSTLSSDHTRSTDHDAQPEDGH